MHAEFTCRRTIRSGLLRSAARAQELAIHDLLARLYRPAWRVQVFSVG